MPYDNPELLTLGDLKPQEVIRVMCGCRTMTLIPSWKLQQRHGLAGDTVILSLLPRFRCEKCGEKNVTKLSVIDETNAANSSYWPLPETVLYER